MDPHDNDPQFWRPYSKKCFIPTCPNNNVKNPDKIFIVIRKEIKDKWCKLVDRKNCPKGSLYCCQDHINFEEDLENYIEFTAGYKPKLKLNSIPINIPNKPKKVIKPRRESTPLTTMSSSVCRICLATYVKFYTIADTPLQLVYEKLTATCLHTADNRPTVACYMCYAYLRKSHKLMLTSAKTENLLTAVLAKHSRITKQSIYMIDRQANGLSNSLSVSKSENIDTPPPITIDVPIKTEEETHDIKTDDFEEPKDGENIDTEEEIDDIETDAVIAEPEGSETNILDDSHQYEDGQIRQQADTDTNIEVKRGDAAVQNSEQNEIVKEIIYSKNTERSGVKRKNKSNKDLIISGDIRHECKICHRQFAKRKHLKRHIRRHTVEKPFECNICQRRFALTSYLKQHLKSHGDEKNFECNICQTRFKRKGTLEQHLKTHNTEKLFECTVCKVKYSTKVYLVRHSRTHTSEKYFECDYCERRFKDRSSFIRHLANHTGAKRYQCEVCKNKFYSNSEHKKHLISHSNVKPYQCPVCHKRYGYKCHMVIHLKTHEKRDSSYSKGTSHVNLLNMKITSINSK